MITLTDTAAVKVKELLEAEGDLELALRVAVRPGGCSGFSYEMFFDGDVAADDEKATFGNPGATVNVVVDSASAQMLAGRHARLQGRPQPGRLLDQQPQRQPHLRLRFQLQLNAAHARNASSRSSSSLWSQITSMRSSTIAVLRRGRAPARTPVRARRPRARPWSPASSAYTSACTITTASPTRCVRLDEELQRRRARAGLAVRRRADHVRDRLAGRQRLRSA